MDKKFLVPFGFVAIAIICTVAGIAIGMTLTQGRSSDVAVNVPIANTNQDTPTNTNEPVVVPTGTYALNVEWNGAPKLILKDKTVFNGSIAPWHNSSQGGEGSNGNQTNFYLAGRITDGEFKDYDVLIGFETTMGTWRFYYIAKKDSTGNYSSPVYAIVPPVLEQELTPWQIKATFIGLETPKELAIPSSVVTLQRDDYGLEEFATSYQKKLLFTTGGVDVYMIDGDTWSGCFLVIRADGTVATYHFGFAFVADDETLDVTFNNGAKNIAQYDFTGLGGCGPSCIRYNMLSDAVDPKTELVAAGKTPQGLTLYQFKDPNHKLLKQMFDDPIASFKTNTPDLTYDQFIAKHPLLYWQDPLGRWIEFQNREFMPAVEMCKPVVYLYPESTTDVNVKVAPSGGVTVSEPTYPATGWEVSAQPNGTLTMADGTTYSSLFWEGTGFDYQRPSAGFVVARGDVSSFLDDKLSYMGMNTAEIKDFKTYWLPRFTAKPYYVISFLDQAVFEELAPLTVTPRPDTVIRVFMDFYGVAQPISIPEQTLAPGVRQGFTVIEWGGAAQRD